MKNILNLDCKFCGAVARIEAEESNAVRAAAEWFAPHRERCARGQGTTISGTGQKEEGGIHMPLPTMPIPARRR